MESCHFNSHKYISKGADTRDTRLILKGGHILEGKSTAYFENRRTRGEFEWRGVGKTTFMCWKLITPLLQITAFVNWPNPSSRTMTPGSTQLLIEMSTRILPQGQRAACRRILLTTSCHLCGNCLENVWTSMSHNPRGLHGLLPGLIYIYISVDNKKRQRKNDCGLLKDICHQPWMTSDITERN
jgi:hypothetical protein